MAETGAQKRKAEDEVNAMGNAELGDTAAPAAKKTKVGSEERTIMPARTVAAARDEGMASTIQEVGEASEAAAPSASAAVDTPMTSTSDPPPAAAVKPASASKEETEPAEAKAEPTGANTDMADANADPPQTLGYKTFSSGDEAFQYFHDLIRNLRQNQDLNEYEANAVLDLVKKGHPEAASKIGPGVRAVQVREHTEMDSVCFHLMRTDQVIENFSTRKCVANLFPKWGKSNQKKTSEHDSRGGRGGRGGRGRGGSRGRGGGRGRGGQRGRGRGRSRN